MRRKIIFVQTGKALFSACTKGIHLCAARTARGHAAYTSLCRCNSIHCALHMRQQLSVSVRAHACKLAAAVLCYNIVQPVFIGGILRTGAIARIACHIVGWAFVIIRQTYRPFCFQTVKTGVFHIAVTPHIRGIQQSAVPQLSHPENIIDIRCNKLFIHAGLQIEPAHRRKFHFSVQVIAN